MKIFMCLLARFHSCVCSGELDLPCLDSQRWTREDQIARDRALNLGNLMGFLPSISLRSFTYRIMLPFTKVRRGMGVYKLLLKLLHTNDELIPHHSRD
ncbi:hypothetical protein F5B18DRAFT_642370 [Nemania serpens]|nr:hypothetical protein F5B18DRAFT_642370 [Nemania serpens]